MGRIHRIVCGIAAATTFTGMAASAGAQGSDSTKSRDLADTSAIDPDAIAALQKMGAYLRTLNVMQVQGRIATEDVLDDGQKVQSTSVYDLIAKRPDNLRVEIKNDRRPRLMVYDGKTFTLWAPNEKFYATVDAPPTINELADTLSDKYDIDLPFVDLFRWGTPEGDVKTITAAMDLGPATVDGATCEQYAFRQEGLDWQVWIQQGEFPLPRRLVLTTMDDDARPQHTAVYTWNLAPSFSEGTFAFVAPADAKRITIAEVAARRDSSMKVGQRP